MKTMPYRTGIIVMVTMLVVKILQQARMFEPSLRSSRTMHLAETVKLLETIGKMRECWELVGSINFVNRI